MAMPSAKCEILHANMVGDDGGDGDGMVGGVDGDGDCGGGGGNGYGGGGGDVRDGVGGGVLTQHCNHS